MMMNWYGGMGWGSWLIACLMMLAFVALVVLVVVVASASRGGVRVGLTAEDVLDRRLAAGEIDVEEYTRTLDVLRKGEDVRRVG